MRKTGECSCLIRGMSLLIRQPDGPARILLQVIDQEPEAVMRALHVGVFTADRVQAAAHVAEGGATYRAKRTRGDKG